MKNVFFLLFVMCFTMCTSKPQGDNVISVDLDKPEKASLFDYFSSIELIPLETSSDALIVGITKMVIHQDNYYTFDPVQQILFVYDKEGNFLYKINKRGQGEGEYLSFGDFNINPYSENLEILNPYGKVHVYDLRGNYIETKRVTYPDFSVVHTIAAVDSQTYVFESVFAPKKIIYYNLDEEKLLHTEFEEDYDLGRFSFGAYQYQSEWFYFRPIHPVVYKMGKDSLETAFQFDFGKYAIDGRTVTLSKESQRDFPRLVEEVFNQFGYMIHAVRHNNKYVFASLTRDDSNQSKSNIIYDKETGKAKYIADFDEDVWFNSYRGEAFIVTDEYALIPCQWIDLEKRINKEMLSEEQQKLFDELLQSDTELNPILIKYWFK